MPIGSHEDQILVAPFPKLLDFEVVFCEIAGLGISQIVEEVDFVEEGVYRAGLTGIAPLNDQFCLHFPALPASTTGEGRLVDGLHLLEDVLAFHDFRVRSFLGEASDVCALADVDAMHYFLGYSALLALRVFDDVAETPF